MTETGEPVDGLWRDWRSVRLEGRQVLVEEEVESVLGKEETKKEALSEESEDDEECCL